MLSVRHIFRLCKQSAQCSLARPSVFFSSNSDDSNNKPPPKKNTSDDDSLDALLGATFSGKKVSKPASKITKTTPKKFAQNQTSKSDSASSESAIKDDSQAAKAVKKGKGNASLETLLRDAHNINDRSASDTKLQDQIASKSEGANAGAINVGLKKKVDSVSSSELVSRIKKIAEDVAAAAGPKSKEVAEDLIKNLENATKTKYKPLNLNELTFEKESNDGADQNLDLLRNKIVSEEQIYKITPGPKDTHFRRPMSERQKEFYEPWSERARPKFISHDVEVSLFPKTKIGIFQLEEMENLKTKSCLHTFEKLENREKVLSYSYAPRNWFEQCIQWTDQGKLWHFPIDNEQGLDEGQTVSFTEHIFLEDHLEGWCPTFGPVRHFMELVCLGLSKNPYLCVEEKIENIMWYRDYFEQHRELLEAAGTLDSGVTKVPALEAQ